jgi:signal transduction histidine kinase
MGMGLAIAHRIVDEHGGRIRCESGARGGALFTVELPRVRAGDQKSEGTDD